MNGALVFTERVAHRGLGEECTIRDNSCRRKRREYVKLEQPTCLVAVDASLLDGGCRGDILPERLEEGAGGIVHHTVLGLLETLQE